MVCTVWPVSCLLFFYSRCPSAQQFVEVGRHAPRAPWSRRHSSGVLFATGHLKKERRGYRRRGNRDCPSTSQITKERGREGTTEGKKRNLDHLLPL